MQCEAIYGPAGYKTAPIVSSQRIVCHHLSIVPENTGPIGTTTDTYTEQSSYIQVSTRHSFHHSTCRRYKADVWVNIPCDCPIYERVTRNVSGVSELRPLSLYSDTIEHGKQHASRKSARSYTYCIRSTFQFTRMHVHTHSLQNRYMLWKCSKYKFNCSQTLTTTQLHSAEMFIKPLHESIATVSMYSSHAHIRSMNSVYNGSKKCPICIRDFKHVSLSVNLGCNHFS